MKRILLIGAVIAVLAGCSGQGNSPIGLSPQDSLFLNTYAPSKMLPDSSVSKIYGDFKWKYDDIHDEMSGKTGKVAAVYTKDPFYLSEPYFGENRGRLVVRKHPRFGSDVMIVIDKGILKHDYVNVRFNDRPMKKYYTDEPESGDSNMLFVDNQKGFINELLKSDSVRVEVRFYQDNPVILRFNVSGLKLP